MKTTPREGDYVNLGKEKSGNLIHFIDANEHRIARPLGFSTAFGDYPSATTVAVLANESLWFMVFCSDEKFHFARTPSWGRELSLSDLLGDELPLGKLSGLALDERSPFHSIPVSDPQWNGEGLPYAGCSCEFRHDDSAWQWTNCKVIFVGKEYIVLSTEDGELAPGLQFVKFRPLKSEREIAIEEMVDLTRKIPFLNSMSAKDMCEKLYDAGYRRVEK